MNDSELLEHIADSFSSHYVTADLLDKGVYHVCFDVPETDHSAYVGHVHMKIENDQILMLVMDVTHEKQGHHHPTTTVPKEIRERLRERYFEDVIAPILTVVPTRYNIVVDLPDLTSDTAVIEGYEVSKEAAREIYHAGVSATLNGEGSYADPTFDEWWRQQA